MLKEISKIDREILDNISDPVLHKMVSMVLAEASMDDYKNVQSPEFPRWERAKYLACELGRKESWLLEELKALESAGQVISNGNEWSVVAIPGFTVSTDGDHFVRQPGSVDNPGEDKVMHKFGETAIMKTVILRGDGSEIVVHTMGMISPKHPFMAFQFDVYERRSKGLQMTTIKRLSISEIEEIKALYWYEMCPFGRDLPRTRFGAKRISIKDFLAKVLRIHQAELV